MQMKAPQMVQAMHKKGTVSREDTWPLELQALS